MTLGAVTMPEGFDYSDRPPDLRFLGLRVGQPLADPGRTSVLLRAPSPAPSATTPSRSGLRDDVGRGLPAPAERRGVSLPVAREDAGREPNRSFCALQALADSEEGVNRLRGQAAEAGGDTITGVERYEVVLDEAPTAP